MNEDIRLKISFKGHRKRRKLRKLLGPSYLDHLIDLFLTVAEERPTGVLDGWDMDDIAHICSSSVKFRGSKQKLLDSFLEARFLEYDDAGTLRVHGWAEHQSYVIKAPDRKAKAKHAATVKAVKKDFCRACSGHYSEDNYEKCPEDCPLKCSEQCPFVPTSSPPFLTNTYTLPILTNTLPSLFREEPPKSPFDDKGGHKDNGKEKFVKVELRCKECKETQEKTVTIAAFEYIQKGIMGIAALNNNPCVYCGAKGKYEYMAKLKV